MLEPGWEYRHPDPAFYSTDAVPEDSADVAAYKARTGLSQFLQL